MAELPQIVTVEDVKNPNLLIRVLRGLSDRIISIGTRVDALTRTVTFPTMAQIRDALQATGSTPINIQNLRGVVADPQPAAALRYDTAPVGLILQTLKDAQFILVKNGASAYDLYTVLAGNPNTLFKLIGGASGGSLMTLDTTQTVTSAGIKTVQAAWTFTVTQAIAATLAGALQWKITNSSNNAAAQALYEAINDAAVSGSINTHSSGRVATRYGVTLGNAVELLSKSGSTALLIGSTDNVPIVFGTNDIERVRIDGNALLSVPTIQKSGGNGSVLSISSSTQLLTLSTTGTTTTGTVVIPTNSLAVGIAWRVTTTISGGGVTQFKIGNGVTTDYFQAFTTSITAGNTGVGMRPFIGSVTTDAAGPTAGGTITVTTDATPTAGAIRYIVYAITLTVPTS